MLFSKFDINKGGLKGKALVLDAQLRPSLAIIFGTFGVVALWMLKIIAIGPVALSSIVIIAVVLLILVKKQ